MYELLSVLLAVNIAERIIGLYKKLYNIELSIAVYTRKISMSML